MALDYSNERYVRLYTRDTTTWKLIDWRGRTVLLHLLRKVDRAGVLDVGDDGEVGLAAVLELPLEEVVTPGIAQLVKRGTVVATPTAYVLPNFLAAQEAIASDRQRQRDARERRRASAMSGADSRDGGTDPRDSSSRSVTDASRSVTERHAESHGVTRCHSDPICADPSQAESTPPSQPPGSAPSAPAAPEREGSETRIRDRSRPAAAGAPASGFAAVVARFDARYRAQNGGAKPTWGDKPGAQLKRLIAQHGVDEVLARIDRLFDGALASWCKPPYDVGTLAAQFDRLAAVTAPPVAASTPALPPGYRQIVLDDEQRRRIAARRREPISLEEVERQKAAAGGGVP